MKNNKSENKKFDFSSITNAITNAAAGLSSAVANTLVNLQANLPSQVMRIRSQYFSNVYLRVDGSNCSPSKVMCGTVNTQFNGGDWEKWVFVYRTDRLGAFCVRSNQFSNVYLYFDGSSCKSSSGPGCGRVSAYYSTSCTDNLLFKTSNKNNCLASYQYPNAVIRVDGSGVTRPYDNGAGSVNGQFYSDINQVGGYEFLIFENTYSQSMVMDAIRKYSPTIYIHENEKYFPIAIESLGVNWSTANGFNDENAKVSTNPNAGMSFNNNAPLYVSVKRSNGNILITYAVLQAFNDCGPVFSITANVVSPVSTTGITDWRISPCPAGKHNSDIEHISVTIDQNFNLVNVIVAYHSWDATFQPSEMQYDGTHPVVYMAIGSHAHYRTEGEHRYNDVWNERSGTTLKCVKYCLGFIPCGFNDCWSGAQTMGQLIDTCTYNRNSAKKYSTSNLVIMKSDFWTIDDSGWSQDLKNFAKYRGRIGLDIVNNGWQVVQQAILNATSPVRIACSSCDNKIRSGLSSINDEMQSAAPGSLASKSWF